MDNFLNAMEYMNAGLNNSVSTLDLTVVELSKSLVSKQGITKEQIEHFQTWFLEAQLLDKNKRYNDLDKAYETASINLNTVQIEQTAKTM